jgi:hypothetical protein
VEKTMIQHPLAVSRPHTGMSRRQFTLASLMTLLSTLLGRPGKAAASTSSLASRSIPARVLPVPDTVSPELQARIAAPYPSD